ncbi:hypothetical protein BDF21DRAFT_416549 [Thamnidium elegans]|uniref:Cyclin n=1 Tax=Thamnidium elegans TaxID=101142 RepID=A0A8H7VQB4_9FUNG|nr:hypothetical protein INT48_002931 [Thamnidium elegans]KAI8083758.1 hypothetical protein BDF21DRAFT_416549 [Thamnidium elegans]
MTLLNITNPIQLAEICATIIPCIWAGTFKRQLLNAKRHQTFKLFVQKVLKSTQISTSCILLSLYYIYKLRLAYPSIRASIGSEVRLFTTSLVLANKYLDDNTFANKTWSQVSSIPISELNIMEMEFLSALNFTIHISQTQFYDWIYKCQQWWNLLSSIPTMTSTNTINYQPQKRNCDFIEEGQKKKFLSIDYYSNVKPILSWSSSVSALSSSRYNNT